MADLTFEERVRRYCIEHLADEEFTRQWISQTEYDLYVLADAWDLDDARIGDWNIELEHEEPYQYSEYTGGGGNTDLWASIPLVDGSVRRWFLGGGDDAARIFHEIIRELVK